MVGAKKRNYTGYVSSDRDRLFINTDQFFKYCGDSREKIARYGRG
jgi:hypothetical protein